MRVGTVILTFAVVTVACGSGEPASTSTTTTPPEPTTTTALSSSTTTSTPAPTTTSTVDTTTTTLPEIDIEFSDGEVSGPEVVEVAVGDTVDVWVVSDVDDEMHVHGYDNHYQLEAGEPFQLRFVADVPGIFDVEVHTNHTLLFQIEVSG